jgi:outer membrane receptor protein involved in Fe transport
MVRATVAALVGAAFTCAGGAWAQGAQTAQQDSDLEEVTVTGSRVITDNVRSPTPITSVIVEDIAKTTPSDIPDALNKLPAILGGRTPRSQGNGGTNNGGNVLSLRNFGVARTLVLLDGHRVAPANQDGSVNVDTLPQMLVSRVDIVTGGASAVYGSDAVAGVVNFVLDKKFTGFKFNADAGISKYTDGEEGQIAAAWGTELFDGRGHFETSARYRKQAQIPISARPYGKDGQQWVMTGNGSATNPLTNTPYARLSNAGQVGLVFNCGTACTAGGSTFGAPGVLRPFIHGTTTGTGTIESGGDGAYIPDGTFRSGISMKDWFGRFSYDLTDNVSAYVQGSWAASTNVSNWVNWIVSPGGGRPDTFFANNPFLSPAAQTSLGVGIACGTPAATGWRCLPTAPAVSPQTGSTPPAPAAGSAPFFSLGSYVWRQIDGQTAGSTDRMYLTDARQRNRNIEIGFDGTLGGLDWNAFYSHGESTNKVINPNNTDNARYLASLDAVAGPNGSVVCWVSTQTAFAGLYPGCVPTNVFDPNGPSISSFNYLRKETFWSLRQKLDNFGASIGGGLWGIGLPAGEIRANLSADARWATYDMISNASPSEFVNCTGLRMCLANGSAPLRWVQNTNAPVSAKNHVAELALEFNVPLLKDLPLAQEVSTNWAGRYTKYSTFSAVQSWKGGLDWHFNDSIRARGTYSRDIRAPNLNDLFAPLSVTSANFTDTLTNTANTTRVVARGNPDLTPEKARTLTAGVVLTPSFLPNFNFSVDYFRTRMTDAIIPLGYGGVQNLCVASAPAFDSNFCSLATRPITNPTDPNYRTAANFPTEIRNSSLNAARLWTHGYDFQLNYGWDMSDLISSIPGRVSFRHLLTYQPVNKTINTPGSPASNAIAPKTRQTTFLSYENGQWGLALQNQWLGRVLLDNGTGASQNYVQRTLPRYSVLDATLSKKFDLSKGGSTEAFVTVSNLLNERAPLSTRGTAGLPGLFYPTEQYHDDMGRFFTAGVRVKF